MIDYEKLKLVYELSNKYKNEHNEYSDITHTYYLDNDYDFFTWTTSTYGEENYNNIDELIYEIQEKLKSKDEYKTGWYIYNWEPVATKVKNAVGYQFCDASDPESLGRVMYDSKSECLLYLIEHWNKLYLEELNKKESTVFLEVDLCRCQHVNKMTLVNEDGTIWIGCKECKKVFGDDK